MDGNGPPPHPLSNFFEFASKEIPILPRASVLPSMQEMTPLNTDRSHLAKNMQPKTFEEEHDGKDYVSLFTKEMEAKIAKAQRKEATGLRMRQPRASASSAASLRSLPISNGSQSVDTRNMMTTIEGTIPLLNINEADDVWNHYNMTTVMYKETSELAVFEYKNKILGELATKQVLIVEGFTGCGKTTQIPQYILQDAYENNQRCNIVVTQPRRLAAVSVAQRVSDERQWQLGSVVGYQVGLSKNTSPSTRLTYVTTGILLQHLISRKCLDEYSHIIIDEVHERDLETDLLLCVIKNLMVDRCDMNTRIILMSATLNPSKFADYFPKWPINDKGVVEANKGPNTNKGVNAAVIQIPLSTFHPVEVCYLDSLGSNIAIDEAFEEPKVHEQCMKVAVEYIISLDQKELAIANMKKAEDEKKKTEDENKKVEGEGEEKKAEGEKKHPNHGRGGVLIFLPGYLEIEAMMNKLHEIAEKRLNDPQNPVDDKWLIFPLHSTITSEEQQRVFTRVPFGFRKIVVATNIAESSITVTDMRYVIDFCLTKTLGCDPVTNYTCLRMEWASQDQCTQRKGRVGRVAPGIVFRMVPIKFWAELPKESVPDMVKSSLENVVLKVKNLDMGSPMGVLANAIDPPRLSLIVRAVAHLKEVGALGITANKEYTEYDGDLTQMGVIMSKLPLDVRFSRLIVLGHIFGVLEETIIIAAGLSGKSPFSHPFSKKLNSYMSKLSWSGSSFSDFFAILCLYKAWHHRWEKSVFHGKRDERQWAKDYFAQLNMIREMRSMVDDIRGRLHKLNIRTDFRRLMTEETTASRGLMLKIAIAGAFYPNYFLRQRPSQKEYEKSIIKELCSHDPMHTIYFSGFPQEQPGQLYAESIASYFKTGNSIPNVIFSTSKVLIQFDPRSESLGRMSLNIYRGLRMRQIRQNVNFGTMRVDQSYDLLYEELDRAKANKKLLSPIQIELPKLNESMVKVIVTHMEVPDLFFVVYENKSKLLQQIARDLALNTRNSHPLRYGDIVVGSLCITEFKGAFFRGRIDFIQNCTDVLVYLLDHGNSVWRKVHHLLSFTQDLCEKGIDTMEAQAVQCRLYGIQPPAKYASLWSEEAKATCAKVCVDRVLYLQVFSVVDNIVAGDLSESGSFEGNESLRQTLLDGKFASPMDENKASKENNYVRYKVNTYGGYTEETISLLNAKQIKPYLPPVTLRPPCESVLVAETTLRGPFSPLEMEFNFLCRSAHMKQVQIEKTSVNTIALDQEPLSMTARLLVAGTVSISQRSGGVSARDTTLMPAVPGMIGLLTMLFCPKLELRVNFPLGRYTGCVSGLGVDPRNGSPVYADHDMEITFDTLFDQEDLQKINGIRDTMNNILRIDATNADSIVNLRESIRKSLNDLLERDREAIEEEWPEETHAWGLIDEHLLIESPTQKQEDGVVFSQHKLVRMTLGADEVYRPSSSSSQTNVFSASGSKNYAFDF